MVTSFKVSGSGLVLQMSTDSRGEKVVKASVMSSGGNLRPIALTPMDHAILRELVLSEGKPIRLAELLPKLPRREEKEPADDPAGAFEVNLSRLHRKLRKELKAPHFKLAKKTTESGDAFVLLFHELESFTAPALARPAKVENLPALKPLFRGYLEALKSLLEQPPPTLRGTLARTRFPRLYVEATLREGRSAAPSDLAAHLLSGNSIQLMAEPGLGKTALLTMVAHELVNVALRRLDEPQVVDALPVVVSGRIWRGPKLLDEAALFVSKLHPEVKAWLRERHDRIVLLLDGTDELLNPAAFVSVLDATDRALDADSPTVGRLRALMVTGRPAAYHAFANAKVEDLTLEELDRSRAEKLLRKLGADGSTPHLRSRGELSGNPLYLTLSMQFARDASTPLAFPELLAAAANYLIPTERGRRAMARVAADQIRLTASGLDELPPADELEKSRLFDEGVITLHQSMVEYLASGVVFDTIQRGELPDDRIADVVAKLGANGIACLWFRLCDSETTLWTFAERLYSQLRVQQYMYDVKGLAGLSARFARLEPHVERGSPRAQVVFLKMLGHAAYDLKSIPEQRRAAREAFSRLLRTLDDHRATLSEGAGVLPFAWYRAFARDHLEHLGGECEPPELSDELRAGSAASAELSRYLVLRAAHYYGHRGNRVLSRRAEGSSVESVETGIDHFRRAVAYRLHALHASFPHAEHLRARVAELVRDVLGPEQRWALQRPTPAKPDARESEGFLTEEQAVGDLANQVIGIGYLECWRYVDGDAAGLPRAKAAWSAGRSLWQLAVKPGAGSTVVRYLLNLGGLAACIELIDGAPRAGALDAALARTRNEFRAHYLEDPTAQAAMQDTLAGLEAALAQRRLRQG